SEYVCLDKCYQHLDYVNKYCKGDRHRRKGDTSRFCHFSKDEDQAHKAQDDDVTGSHVGKQTHDQGEGLGEYTHQLYRQHEEFYTYRNTGIPEDMAPEMSVGAEQDNDQRDNTQYGSESDIASYVGAAGQQTKQVIDQDKKE